MSYTCPYCGQNASCWSPAIFNFPGGGTQAEREPVEASAVVARDDARHARVLQEIADERRRQVASEGWTPEHDDSHGNGELAHAAAAYACLSDRTGYARKLWPFDAEPKDHGYRRNLIRAAALLVAELERMDRRLAEQGD